MTDYIPDKLVENEYYHGTMAYKAIQILYEGFRLKKIYDNGGHFTQGLYLTKSLSSASYFGYGEGYIFKCRLSSSIPILWLNGKYDQKVISYLKREFSKDILTGNISKVIHRNKKLTKNELIHLLNYRFSKADFHAKESKKRYWYNSVSSFRQQLQFHQYNGFGEVNDLCGVVIFNPSLVEPIDLYKVFERKDSTSTMWPKPSNKLLLRKIDKSNFIKDIDRYYNDYIKPSPENDDSLSQEEINEWNYIHTLQKRYCEENGLL